MAADTQKMDAANTANNVSSSAAWVTAGKSAVRRMWLPDSPETVYTVEMRPMGDAQAVVCISTLAKR